VDGGVLPGAVAEDGAGLAGLRVGIRQRAVGLVAGSPSTWTQASSVIASPLVKSSGLAVPMSEST
jgi:hypothetical protein